MTDKELLLLAAKAAGIEADKSKGNGAPSRNDGFDLAGNLVIDWHNGKTWNPLLISDDAFNLAADLELDIMHRVVGGRRVEVLAAGGPLIQEFYKDDRKQAIRRAVTRAAAQVGSKRNDSIPPTCRLKPAWMLE